MGVAAVCAGHRRHRVVAGSAVTDGVEHVDDVADDPHPHCPPQAKVNCVQLTAKTLVASLGVIGLGTFLAVPATADPASNPCQLAVSVFCRFVPMAPELDGDVDLTKQLPPADPAALPPDSLPPVDICADGCV